MMTDIEIDFIKTINYDGLLLSIMDKTSKKESNFIFKGDKFLGCFRDEV